MTALPEEGSPGDAVIRLLLALVPYPVGGGLGVAYEFARDSIRTNTEQTVQSIIEAFGDEWIRQRMTGEPRLSVLFADAVEAASRTSLAFKRQLLARAVVDAVDDDTKLDESELVVMALRDLETPHVMALARIADTAEQARGSEPHRNKLVTAAASREPEPVQAALVRHGLIDQQWGTIGGRYVSGLTSFGRRLLDDLQRQGFQGNTSGTRGGTEGGTPGNSE